MPEEAKHKPVKYDAGVEQIITDVIGNLLNQYPGLLESERIRFSSLKEDSGIAFYPVSGAKVMTESKDVLGKVSQQCNYPFYVVYRTATDSENSKRDIKEFLDKLGDWIDMQPVIIEGQTYQLKSYPKLSDNREIKEISVTDVASPGTPNENGVQDWVIGISFKYQKTFYRNK